MRPLLGTSLNTITAVTSVRNVILADVLNEAGINLA